MKLQIFRFQFLRSTILLLSMGLLILSSCANSETLTPGLSTTDISQDSQEENPNIDSKSTPLSTCDLINDQLFYEALSTGTLIFSFENGSCWVSDQWETKSIQVAVFQGPQADQAIRWFTREMLAGWNRPDLISYVNQLVADGQGLSLIDFQEELIPFYEQIDYRTERIFSVGDTAFWYTYPQATANLLEITQGDIYLRISINGLFPEEALVISQNIARQVLDSLPDVFSIDFDLSLEEAIEYATPTSPSTDLIPVILSIAADRTNIFFGDLCGDETTRIQVRIEEKGLVNDVYLVYRLVSESETNTNWVTRSMNRQDEGFWDYTLSAEGDFPTYKVVNGANVEYAISILYSVDAVLRSPTIRTITVNQCILK